LVSPKGIDLNGEAEGRSQQADAFRGEANERSELESPEGIEPSTNRLRDGKEPESEGGGS
jgi:hypothetical protein